MWTRSEVYYLRSCLERRAWEIMKNLESGTRNDNHIGEVKQENKTCYSGHSWLIILDFSNICFGSNWFLSHFSTQLPFLASGHCLQHSDDTSSHQTTKISPLSWILRQLIRSSAKFALFFTETLTKLLNDSLLTTMAFICTEKSSTVRDWQYVINFL